MTHFEFSIGGEVLPPEVPISKTFFTIFLNDVQRFDTLTGDVTKSIGDNNAVSTANFKFKNYAGRNKSSFSINDEVKVYCELDADPPYQQIFLGTIQNIRYDGKEQDETIEIQCRDYTSLMRDRTVEPVVFYKQEVSVVVTAIMAAVPEIALTNVDVTTATITISFNHISIFDALKQLADYAQCNFWVDETKVLNFKSKASTSSGVTLDNTNVLKSNIFVDRESMYNDVWVYGDKVLTAYQETFACDGGSEFTLAYNPHNTTVFGAGSTVPKNGGIFEMVSFNPVGVDFLVDYDKKKLVFVSGTDAGNQIPASGGSIIVDYQRGRPIIKHGLNRNSMASYGQRVKVIVDKNIKDPNMAQNILTNELDNNSEPVTTARLDLKDVVNLVPGTTVNVNLPNENMNNQSLTVVEAKYTINKNTLLSNTVLSVKLNKKNKDAMDMIKQTMIDLKKIQTDSISSTDVITRLETALISQRFKVKSWYVKQRYIGGFILGNPGLSVLGSAGQGLGSSGTTDYSIAASGGDL